MDGTCISKKVLTNDAQVTLQSLQSLVLKVQSLRSTGFFFQCSLAETEARKGSESQTDCRNTKNLTIPNLEAKSRPGWEFAIGTFAASAVR